MCRFAKLMIVMPDAGELLEYALAKFGLAVLDSSTFPSATLKLNINETRDGLLAFGKFFKEKINETIDKQSDEVWVSSVTELTEYVAASSNALARLLDVIMLDDASKSNPNVVKPSLRDFVSQLILQAEGYRSKIRELKSLVMERRAFYIKYNAFELSDQTDRTLGAITKGDAYAGLLFGQAFTSITALFEHRACASKESLDVWWLRLRVALTADALLSRSSRLPEILQWRESDADIGEYIGMAANGISPIILGGSDKGILYDFGIKAMSFPDRAPQPSDTGAEQQEYDALLEIIVPMQTLRDEIDSLSKSTSSSIPKELQAAVASAMVMCEASRKVLRLPGADLPDRTASKRLYGPAGYDKQLDKGRTERDEAAKDAAEDLVRPDEKKRDKGKKKEKSVTFKLD